MKQRKAHQSRKAELFQARLRVVESMGLQHGALFNRLNAQNMSGDEQDGLPPNPRYRIVESRWQSTQLKTFLRELDAMYRKSRETSRFSGPLPRRRVVDEHSTVEDGYPAVGLWRNCYDFDWLQALEPTQRDALEVVDEDYDFSLPVDNYTADTA